MTFIVSLNQGPHGLVVVVTDKEILGKKIEEDLVQLDLTKEFYQGEEKGIEEVKEIFQKAQHLHLTGRASVALGIELDLVNPDRILYVQGTPHAEVVIE